MLETISKETDKSIPQKSTELESDTDFTLDEHYKERIAFHMRMLGYYLDQQQNGKLAT